MRAVLLCFVHNLYFTHGMLKKVFGFWIFFLSGAKISYYIINDFWKRNSHGKLISANEIFTSYYELVKSFPFILETKFKWVDYNNKCWKVYSEFCLWAVCNLRTSLTPMLRVCIATTTYQLLKNYKYLSLERVQTYSLLF